MSRWNYRNDVAGGADYDSRWAAMQAAGESVHGEADLVSALLELHGYGHRAAVLDAGCGTGRVGIELRRRGLAVVGVDLDPGMLARAESKAPSLSWIQGDLCNVDLGRRFDMVVMAGNVMIFLAPGTEQEVLTNMALHLEPGGLLLAGFQLGRLRLNDYDRHAGTAGLTLQERWATWHQDPYRGGDYAVSLHRLNSPAGSDD